MNLITIQPIQLNDVLNDDGTRFNSNNHWVNGEKPSDYYQKNRECNTDTWIDLFEREYKTFIIPRYHVKWMKKASKIGNLTGEFPKSFIEKLEDYLRENQLPSPGRFFIRTNSHSLKYGKYGLKPYSDLREVIISLVTSPITHDPLHSIDDDCILYLIKWIEIEKKKEFRVFVFNQKITAISQQNIYSKLIDREDDLKRWIKIILRYFYSEINRRLSHLKNYVMDFVLIGEDNQPYLIEVNLFGSEYSSGSALFHWIRDHEISYENGEDVTVRYIV